MMKRICAYSNNLQKKRNKPTGICISVKENKERKSSITKIQKHPHVINADISELPLHKKLCVLSLFLILLIVKFRLQALRPE